MLVLALWAHFPNSYDSGINTVVMLHLLLLLLLLLFNAIHLLMKQTKIH